MKLSCLQENLNKGLLMVGRLVSTKSTLEILSHILLKTESGRLKISATNLEIGINYKIGSKIDSEGEITVPARLFNDLIGQLPEGKIDISLKDETLFLKTGNFQSQIKGLSAEEFPLIPRIKEKKLFSVPGGQLKDAINLVSFSAALDETRPVLSGIYFLAEKGKLILAATDSYRLSEKVISLETKDFPRKEVVVPARSLMELARVLDDPEKNVSVYLDDNQIMFETDDLEFTSRLVEGKFPDYRQIIPSDFETTAKCQVSDFSKVVRVASLFAREAAGSVTMKIDKTGKIEVLSASTQVGDSSGRLEADVKGKEAEIVFNSKYLTDVLGSLAGGEMTIELSGKLNPGVLRKTDDKSFVYVIMPLRA